MRHKIEVWRLFGPVGDPDKTGTFIGAMCVWSKDRGNPRQVLYEAIRLKLLNPGQRYEVRKGEIVCFTGRVVG